MKQTRPSQTHELKWTTGVEEGEGMGGDGEQNKKRLKTLPNSTVTLMPRLLSFLDSSTSNRSPGRRLLTPGALPFKLSVTCSCKQRTAVLSRIITSRDMQTDRPEGGRGLVRRIVGWGRKTRAETETERHTCSVRIHKVLHGQRNAVIGRRSSTTGG